MVRDAVIISRAYEELPNSWDVTGHAELLAVHRTCQDTKSRSLARCSLYTTAEPCWICAYAIRETGIGTVVIGATTPVVGAFSSKYPILSDPAIVGWPDPHRIITGILEEQCIAARD